MLLHERLTACAPACAAPMAFVCLQTLLQKLKPPLRARVRARDVPVCQTARLPHPQVHLQDPSVATVMLMLLLRHQQMHQVSARALMLGRASTPASALLRLLHLHLLLAAAEEGLNLAVVG